MMEWTGLDDLDVVVKGRVERNQNTWQIFFGMSNYMLFIEVSKFQAVASDGVGYLKFSVHHARVKIIIKLSNEVAK